VPYRHHIAPKLLLSISAQTSSQKSCLEFLEDRQQEAPCIKARLKSSPIENRANLELIELLAKHYQVPKANVVIKKGLKSKNKIVEILNPRHI
jgi:uncharacterized protein (TIGR00251 family)